MLIALADTSTHASGDNVLIIGAGSAGCRTGTAPLYLLYSLIACLAHPPQEPLRHLPEGSPTARSNPAVLQGDLLSCMRYRMIHRYHDTIWERQEGFIA